MTVEPYAPGAGAWGDLGDVGLEDVNSSDIQMPRIQINHADGTFKDAATGTEYPELTCVVLGLVKQRIMWDTEVDDGDKPQCKSPDFEHGFPQMRVDIPTRKQFPWTRSNFNQADYPPNEDGQTVLPCEACAFTKWGADKAKPPCSEQYTLPLFYLDNDGSYRPGVLSLQRSGIKAAKTYVGTFAVAKQPMFTVLTRINLKQESRGKVVYATPSFAKGENSDASMWPEWSTQYRSVREFLRQPPRPATKEADEEEASKRSSRPAPATAKAATKIADDDPWSAPAATGAPAAVVDDELPF